jgi:hypothetical protein
MPHAKKGIKSEQYMTEIHENHDSADTMKEIRNEQKIHYKNIKLLVHINFKHQHVTVCGFTITVESDIALEFSYGPTIIRHHIIRLIVSNLQKNNIIYSKREVHKCTGNTQKIIEYARKSISANLW